MIENTGFTEANEPALGAGGLRFKSGRPDQFYLSTVNEFLQFPLRQTDSVSSYAV